MRSNPTISPDGQWLVFRVMGARSYDLVRVDGSGKRRIDVPVDPLTGDFSAAMSRDSRDLMFFGRDTISRALGVYRMPLAGGEVKKIMVLDDASSATTRDISISPDGSTIAYLTRGQPATRLGEINIAALLPPAMRR